MMNEKINYSNEELGIFIKDQGTNYMMLERIGNRGFNVTSYPKTEEVYSLLIKRIAELEDEYSETNFDNLTKLFNLSIKDTFFSYQF